MSIKKYSLKKSGGTYLSDHFQVKEFASAGQGKTYSDTVLIDTALVKLLEKVYKHFNCSSIIISSGYRTSAHDIAVGGSGSGYHVKGQAADFCCYDKNKKAIPSSKVVLYLEDIKCYGIGFRCGGSDVYTHADTRAESAKWWGDESKNFLDISQINSSKSFYTYLGVKKTATTTKTSTTTTAPKKKTMSISDAGVDGIKFYEGLSLVACKALPTEEYLTIGYGHYGADVKPGQTITKKGALELLKNDLKDYVAGVNKALKVGVTQNQFDALVSFAYNCGIYGLQSSDLISYLNKGEIFKAAAEFPLWRKSGGAIIAGLQNRRARELKLFMKGETFALTDKMNVRKSASTGAAVVKTIKSGTKVKVTDVSVSYSPSQIDIWCKCSSGWICFKQGDAFFAK